MRQEETFAGNSGLEIFAVAFCSCDLPLSLDMYKEGFRIGAAAAISESGGQNVPKNGISSRHTHTHTHRHTHRHTHTHTHTHTEREESWGLDARN